jgi:1-acyl-sn-glycerol-3-phosphate acyltransferase
LRPGFCLLARRSGATIVPVAIRGAYLAMPRGSSFPRPRGIALTFAPPIESSDYQQISDEQLLQLVKTRIASSLDGSSMLEAHALQRDGI